MVARRLSMVVLLFSITACEPDISSSARGSGERNGQEAEAPGSTTEAARLQQLKDIVPKRVRSQPGEGRALAEEGLALARRLGEPLEEAFFSRQIGNAYFGQSEDEKALSHYLRSARGCGEVAECASSALNNAAVIFEQNGNYLRSLEYYRRAHELCARRKDVVRCRRLLNSIANNMAAIHLRLRQFEDAYAIVMEAIEDRRADGLPPGTLLLNQTEALVKLGRTNEALEVADRAVAFARSGNHPRLLGVAQGIRGNALRVAGRLDDAHSAMEEAQDAFESMGFSRGLFELELLFVQLALARNELEPAKRHVKAALEAADTVEITPEERALALRLGTEVAVRGRSTSEALDLLEQYYLLVEERFTGRIESAIAISRAEFDLEKSELELERLEQERDIQNLKLEQQRLLLMSGGVGIVLLLTLFGVSVVSARHLRSLNGALSEMNGQLERGVEEREWLVKEMNHRINGNLQVISSLVGLEEQRPESDTTDEDRRRFLRELRSRIHAVGLIHRELYTSEVSSEVDIQPLLSNLSEHLGALFDRDVEIAVEVAPMTRHLELDRTVPVGLIACELMSNALEHAFEGQSKKGRITVRFGPADEELQLVVEDDGRGLPDDFDVGATKSLGLQLVQNLTLQLVGSLRLEKGSGDEGLRAEVRFPRLPAPAA